MGIPVIDAGNGAALRDAFSTIGFAAVTGHGIAPELFSRMRAVSSQLFALDPEDKAPHRITPGNYRGWIPLGFFTPNRAEVSGARADLYEGWKLHWDCPADHPVRAACGLYGENIWPAVLPELRTVVTDYWSACDTAAAPLMAALAEGLEITPAEFLAWHDAPLTNMTLLHYPGVPQDEADSVAGIHPHKDTNVITLLHPDPVGGLEVRDRDGDWIDVDVPADSLLVNVGEMLELWSGGRWVATPHRVVHRAPTPRIAFPFFVVPNHDVVVDALLPRVPGFDTAPMPVGPLSAEVWRTNWPDQEPSDAGHDLGSLDR